jgi:hypothetical protein
MPPKGSKQSDEARRKISESKKGNIPWNKGKPGLQVGSFKGKHHSEESNLKNRLAHLGNHASEETRKKMSKQRKGRRPWNKGNPATEETKRKCSIANKGEKGYWWGKPFPEEMKKKISDSRRGKYKGGDNHFFGKKHTDKSKMKQCETKVGGFWIGNIIYYNSPIYCELWKDVNPRVHAFFDYKCVLCGAPENGRSHIGHHVFYVKEACCWHSDEGIYYTNLNARNHPANDYCIGENPNYFVILCRSCHGKTNGGFENRKRYADLFKQMIDDNYGGNCYLPRES